LIYRSIQPFTHMQTAYFRQSRAMKNFFKTMDFRKKIFLAGIIGAVFAIPIFLGYLPYEEKIYLTNEFQSNAIKIANLIASDSMPYLLTQDEEALKENLSKVVKMQDVLLAYITLNGKIISTGDPSFFTPISKLEKGDLVENRGNRGIRVTVPVNINTKFQMFPEDFSSKSKAVNSTVTVILSTASIEGHTRHLFLYLALCIVLILSISVLVGWVATGLAVKPIKETAGLARAIRPQNPANIARQEDELSLIFNSLKDLNQEIETKKQLIAQLKEEGQKSNDERHNFHLQIVHDIKTPLNEIALIVEDFKRQNLPSNFPIDYFQRLKEITVYTNKLLSMLVEVEKLEKGDVKFEKKEIKVKDLISSVISCLANQFNETCVTCLTEVQHENLVIKVNQIWFQQVLMNIVQNAVGHSTRGSKVIVSAKEHDGQIMLSIQDFGPGIPKEEQSKLFIRTIGKKEGSGLGLYLCSYLVKLHNGKIWFETREGEGTTFIISLPKEDSVVEQAKPEITISEINPSKIQPKIRTI
jgi:signal transduction histidine kinase